jgi:hypothetical protein
MKTPTDQYSALLAIGNPGPAIAGQCEGTFDKPCNPTMFIWMIKGSETGYPVPPELSFLYVTRHGHAIANIAVPSIYDDKWHDISITRANYGYFTLKIDESIETVATIDGIPDPIPPNSEMSIGWAKFILPSDPTRKFVGCVANVSINGVPIDTFAKNGTVYDTCP